MVMPALGGQAGAPDIGALLGAIGGGGGPQDTPDQGGGGGDPLGALQSVIQDLHTLISVLPDPQMTQAASQCLAILTKMQAGLMQTQQGASDAGQKLAQQLGG